MSPPSPRTVQCYHCRRQFDVPPKAMSISCPWCYKRVSLDDLVVRDTCWTSRLQTCGRIVVQRKGSLVASLVEASEGMEIHGHVEGRVIAGGPVLIGPKARVKADLSAPSIWVEPGASIEGGYFQITGSPAGIHAPPSAATPQVPERPMLVVAPWRPSLKLT